MTRHWQARVMRGERRRGFGLIDCLLAAVLVALIGVGILSAMNGGIRATHHLRSELLMREFGMDLLDRLSVGEARLLLTLPQSAPWTFSRPLESGELASLLPKSGTDPIAPFGARVVLEAQLLAPPRPGRAIRFAKVSCHLSWRDPIVGGRKLSLSTLTGAL